MFSFIRGCVFPAKQLPGQKIYLDIKRSAWHSNAYSHCGDDREEGLGNQSRTTILAAAVWLRDMGKCRSNILSNNIKGCDRGNDPF